MTAILLAAGAATRMGQLKQLLPYRGKTLVAGAVAKARAAGFDPVFVVVGAEAASVQASIAAERVTVVQNPDWQQGMGASIAAGMRQLRADGVEAAAVAILLADQPLITTDHLLEMRTRLTQSNASVVAAGYSGTLGVPAIFRRSLFNALENLPPSAGARQLLMREDLSVEIFALPEAAVDVDTPEDWAALETTSSEHPQT